MQKAKLVSLGIGTLIFTIVVGSVGAEPEQSIKLKRGALNDVVGDQQIISPTVKRPFAIGRGDSYVDENSIQCYQRGVLVVDEKLASNAVFQLQGQSASTTGRNGQQIQIFPIGESLCLIKSDGKILQK